jgi:hypothetical protein
VVSIDVVVRVSAGMLLLDYWVTGAISELSLPSVSSSRRSDRLWEHMCLEAFLQSAGAPAYYEFNFAPSTEWAAYRLEDYRSGMTSLAVEPSVEVRSSLEHFELRAALQLPPDASKAIGLAAVIEEKNGCKSYWALAHPPGAPDFHHKDCFAAQLPEMTGS